MRRWIALTSLALSLALAGCGGGGGGADTGTTSGGSSGGDSLAAKSIAPQQTLTSHLTPVDLRYEQVDPATGDVSYLEAYRVTLPTAGTLTVLMQSKKVDSYLQLFDASFLDDPTDDGAFIAESDDVGTTLDSMISETLDAGTYVIVANTAFENSSDIGEYKLTTLFSE